MINIAAWNIRGLNSPLKLKEVFHFIQSNSIQFFGILETKLSASSLDILKTKFDSKGSWSIQSNILSTSRARIIIGWSSATIQACQIISSSPQFMHCLLIAGGQRFYVTMIYAFNQIQYRAPLWSELTSISQSMFDPWVLLGDFNCLLSTQDRIGSPVAMRETTELNDFFSNCGISDIPHTGFKFTWSNKRYSSSIIHCKLDRVCCNGQWIAAFPDSHAIFSPPGISDHCP
uniref:Endonuclease/exonuclease/phosphatase domain-containing protein n=1 Tax=Kalanchoe fedtschenkoi TaxID=63787 RepID=A0A7N0UJE1_KALFE